MGACTSRAPAVADESRPVGHTAVGRPKDWRHQKLYEMWVAGRTVWNHGPLGCLPVELLNFPV